MTVTLNHRGCRLQRAAWRRLLTALTGVMLAFFAVLQSGCSPTYNWREYRDPDGTYRVLMPGRVSELSREINLDGIVLPMSMSGALVDSTRFAVGMVRLKEAGQRDHVLVAMRTAMLRNIAAHTHRDRACEVPVIDASGQALTRVAAQCVSAQGRANNSPQSMEAMFVARGDYVWQVVVIGERIDGLQAQTLFEAFRIVGESR
jgi:hypothetical protein